MALPLTETWSQSTGSPQNITVYGPYAVLEGSFSVPSGTNGLAFGSGAYNTARRTDETFNAAQFSQVTLLAYQLSNGYYCGPAVRCQSGANTSYHVETNGSNYYLSKGLAGAQSSLASAVSLSFSAGDVLRLEVEEIAGTTTLRVYKALAASPTSFTLHATYTDTASPITTAGTAGVFGYGNAFDNATIGTWAAGNLAAAAVDMPPQFDSGPLAVNLIGPSVLPLALDWSVNVAAIVGTLGQASSTGATGRAGCLGDTATAHGAPTVASGRAGSLGGAPSFKDSPSAATGRAGVRSEVGTSKATASAADGRLAGRGSVVSAEGAVHAAEGRLGARGSVATIPAFGVVTQATGRAGVIGDANSSKVAQVSAAGRAGATGSALAAKGSAGGSDGRAGLRSEASASKSVLHGASGSLAARGAALAAEGAVHTAAGRIGARASVTTSAAFGATSVAGGRLGARGVASSAKAIASDASGRAGLLCNALLTKAITLPSSGRLGMRGLVDTSGIPPIETTADGRLGVRGEAITVLGGTSSSGTGTGGVGRMVTPSYKLQPLRRKRRPGADQQQVGTAVDLAPGPLAGTAAAGSAPAQAPIQPAAEVDRWRLAREQDLEFETKVLPLI